MYIYHNILAGVNALSEDGNLQFHQLVFRCGWATKNIHTAFDYIFNSENKDSVCGKILSKWNQPNHQGEILGGCPPDVADIKSEVETMKTFLDEIFIHQVHMKDNNVKNLLVGSILLWENDFKEILEKRNNPLKANLTSHLYMATIEKTKRDIGEFLCINYIYNIIFYVLNTIFFCIFYVIKYIKNRYHV